MRTIMKRFNLLFVFTNNYTILARTGVILLTVRAQTPYHIVSKGHNSLGGFKMYCLEHSLLLNLCASGPPAGIFVGIISHDIGMSPPHQTVDKKL